MIDDVVVRAGSRVHALAWAVIVLLGALVAASLMAPQPAPRTVTFAAAVLIKGPQQHDILKMRASATAGAEPRRNLTYYAALFKVRTGYLFDEHQIEAVPGHPSILTRRFATMSSPPVLDEEVRSDLAPGYRLAPGSPPPARGQWEDVGAQLCGEGMTVDFRYGRSVAWQDLIRDRTLSRMVTVTVTPDLGGRCG